MHATYSIVTDKLKAWFDSRLSEADYKAARHAGFVFWHGSKCFAAKWSTQAEDFLRDMGIAEVQEDDRPDDVEARVERFQGYADGAEKSGAERRQGRSRDTREAVRKSNCLRRTKSHSGRALAQIGI